MDIISSFFKVAIDLLPFGQVEEKSTPSFDKRITDLHLLVFKEVLEESISVLIEETIAQIPPLQGIVILKLVAWSDRPENRGSDLNDILLIFQRYYELEWNDIVENHNDIFPVEEELDPFLIAARVLGRKSSPILNKSDELKNRILQVIDADNMDTIAVKWALENDWTVDYAIKIINEYRIGIIES